ncbi:MAG: putative membrane protein (GlpM family), partial [Planctomycetaceae bacterium]
MTLENAVTTELSVSPGEVPWSYVVCTGWFAAFFAYFSYIPLWHTDIWGHVAYGQWMLDHGRLPDVDPFVDLAGTTPLIATAWLSQVLFGALERSGGPERLSCAFAVISVSIYLMLALLFLLQTRRLGLAVSCSILTWLVSWDRHLVVRPELLGYLLLAALLTLLSAARLIGPQRHFPSTLSEGVSTKRKWLIRCAAALLFVAWVNMHGSFAVGIVVIAILAAGELFDCVRQSRSIAQLKNALVFRELLLLLLIASAATLVNPYGIYLPLHVLTFGSNPNMASISEWLPPELFGATSVAVFAASILFIGTLPLRQKRPTTGEWLLVAVFTAAVCLRTRMVTWYAPVVVLLLVPALHGLLSRIDHQPWMRRLCLVLSRQSRVQAALLVLLVWLAFSFTPISQPVLGGRRRPPEQLFKDDTPLGITMFLRQASPQGRVANPQWWGDWLAWAGPRGMQLMMTTNSLHLVPSNDYENHRAICWGHPGLERRLNDYEVQVIVVDTSLQIELAEFIRTS